MQSLTLIPGTCPLSLLLSSTWVPFLSKLVPPTLTLQSDAHSRCAAQQAGALAASLSPHHWA